MAGPVDPRLLRQVGAARRFVLLTGLLQAASVVGVIGQAVLIAGLVADLVTDGRVAPHRLARDTALLTGLALARATLVWGQERLSHRSAARVIGDIRAAVLKKVVGLGPRWRPDSERPTAGGEPASTRNQRHRDDMPETAVIATQGLDGLEPYLVRFLPALLLTALATPVVLMVIGVLDPIALAICLVTLPIVSLFMWLIGQMTAGVSERRLAVVARLGAQVLDLITGLPTLRAFGREIGPGARVRALGEASRTATMGTLRVAFLSAMVLELLTTLSVAMVAVSVGLRLVAGSMTLRAGLAVIMLAPEVFAPLRQVAAQFHASSDGLAATDAVFAVLGTPHEAGFRRGSTQRFRQAGLPRQARQAALPGPPVQAGPLASAPPPEPVTAILLDDLGVFADDRDILAPAHLSTRIDVSAGRVVALVGPTGAGKSTTTQAILGLLAPDQGTVRLRSADGAEHSPADYGLDSWWRQLIWLPQRPACDPSTAHLSVGQRHRHALAAALDSGRDRRILILDEPTAHLDAATELDILDTLRSWRATGRTAIVVAHRPSVIAIADQIVEVRSEGQA